MIVKQLLEFIKEKQIDESTIMAIGYKTKNGKVLDLVNFVGDGLYNGEKRVLIFGVEDLTE